MARVKRAKPQDFWDGKTSVYSSKKIARGVNTIVQFAESLVPYERDELLKKIRALVEAELPPHFRTRVFEILENIKLRLKV